MVYPAAGFFVQKNFETPIDMPFDKWYYTTNLVGKYVCI